MSTEPNLPVGDYCAILWEWLDLLVENSKDPAWARSNASLVAIADVAYDIRLGVEKSNYLARRIYGREEHRTEKCPVHQGNWSGYAFSRPCEHGCSQGVYDITGWLPVGGTDAILKAKEVVTSTVCMKCKKTHHIKGTTGDAVLKRSREWLDRCPYHESVDEVSEL